MYQVILTSTRVVSRSIYFRVRIVLSLTKSSIRAIRALLIFNRLKENFQLTTEHEKFLFLDASGVRSSIRVRKKMPFLHIQRFSTLALSPLSTFLIINSGSESPARWLFRKGAFSPSTYSLKSESTSLLSNSHVRSFISLSIIFAQFLRSFPKTCDKNLLILRIIYIKQFIITITIIIHLLFYFIIYVLVINFYLTCTTGNS